MPAQRDFSGAGRHRKRSLVVRGGGPGARYVHPPGGGGGHGINQSKEVPAQPLGKISTFVQMAAAVTWMVENIWPVPALHAISSAMLWVCALFTVWSGIHYTLRGAQTLRAR